MEIDELCFQVYEESEGRLTSQSCELDGSLLLEFECDDWEGTDRRRRFALRCEEVKDARVHLGFVGGIGVHKEHPLLERFRGKQGDLYFSSVPTSPEWVFARAHETLHRHFDGWMEPSTLLHETPDRLLSNLKAGYGLLARGPVSALRELRSSLEGALKLQLIECHTEVGEWVVLDLEDSYIVCARIDVREHDV